MAVSHGVPVQGRTGELLGAKELMRPVVGVGRNMKYFQGTHLLRVLLEASGEVTYNGVVSMRKERFLSRDGFQWELKMHQKSRPRLVPVGAGVALQGGKAQLI